MKLSSEQHSELSKMAEHFSHIEDIAELMGVEVDTLTDEISKSNNAVYANLKKNLLTIASRRQQIFRKNDSQNIPEAKQINRFSVIVNEQRFRN